MADEDNFDIDIYGDDGGPQDYQESSNTGNAEATQAPPPAAQEAPPVQDTKMNGTESETKPEPTTESAPADAKPQQGTKRKEIADDRPVDAGATTALVISDLNWWDSEDEVRSWAHQADCEDELKDVTFNEHKVNGKSKGQAFVEFTTQQASTALKHKIESFDPAKNKHYVQYHNPNVNPYKTLPKDAPNRTQGNRNENRGGSYNSNNNFNNRGNFGGRGNFNRGGMNNNMGGGGFNNRNFSGPAGMGGMGGPNQGGFGGPGGPGGPMGNFGGGGAGGMGMNFGAGGNFNRGGMMGGMRGGMPNNRGGRGGMGGGPGMMGGMNMGGMNGMGMGGPGMMPGMNANMGMGMQGFGGGGHNFNPGFFGNQQGGGQDNWNPHGAKRQRPE